jgi:hypothetical protein
MPVEKLEGGTWPHPSRLPLGCGWRGHCTAPGHEGAAPSQDVLEAFCNLGYASSCSWAPRERAWDAVRFAVAAPTEKDDRRVDASHLDHGPQMIRVIYVCERNHSPAESGNLEFDMQRSMWLRLHDDARVQKMAECFLEAFLKKKS